MKNKQAEQVLEEHDLDIKELIFDNPQKTKEEEAFFSYDNRFLVIIFAVAIVALFLLVIYMYYKSDDKEKEEELLKNNVLLPDYTQPQNFDFMKKGMNRYERNKDSEKYNEKDSLQEKDNNKVKEDISEKSVEAAYNSNNIQVQQKKDTENKLNVKEDNIDSDKVKDEIDNNPESENKKPVVLNTANEVDEILKITSTLI
jgi:hypothetical protein